MWAKVKRHWFLLSIAVCFAVGYFAAVVWKPLLEMSTLRAGIVFTVMWAMGVTLRPNAILKSVSKPLPSLLAIGTNVFLVPLLCLPSMFWLPERLFGGLFVTAIVPCTLASASVWTRKAGGNDSVAMMTTVVTNLACVVVAPVGIMLVLTSRTAIPVGDQISKLFAIVVLPLILAQVMRGLGAARWADKNKTGLSVLAQCGMLAMVTFGAATSAGVMGGPGAKEPTPWFVGALLLISAAGLHTVAIVWGIALAKGLRLDRASQIAVGIAGSQKTLAVGLQIAIDSGVSVVPMILYHLSQLVIDTLVAERWKAKTGQSESEEKV